MKPCGQDDWQDLAREGSDMVPKKVRELAVRRLLIASKSILLYLLDIWKDGPPSPSLHWGGVMWRLRAEGIWEEVMHAIYSPGPWVTVSLMLPFPSCQLDCRKVVTLVSTWQCPMGGAQVPAWLHKEEIFPQPGSLAFELNDFYSLHATVFLCLYLCLSLNCIPTNKRLIQNDLLRSY